MNQQDGDVRGVDAGDARGLAHRGGVVTHQVLPGLVTPYIGNSYNASALIGLSRILDDARPGDRILLAPFGSGAGSDAYSIVVTDKIIDRKDKAPKVEDYLARKKIIDYGMYAKCRGLIKRVRR